MTKERLIKKINEILKTDFDLGFLLELKKEDIERLVACIRGRLDRQGAFSGVLILIIDGKGG